MSRQLCIIGSYGRHLPRFAELLTNVVDNVYVILIVSSVLDLKKLNIRREISVMPVTHNIRYNAVMRLLEYTWTQFKVLVKLLLLYKKAYIYLFYIGGEHLVIPMFVLKLMGRKIILMPGGNSARILAIKNDPLSSAVAILTKISTSISDKIIIKSDRIIREWKLERYRAKILISHEFFIDFDMFRIQKPFGMRENLVGYIGRLSEEKGIINFVSAIPQILERNPNIKFLIRGDGHLLSEIKKSLDKMIQEGKIIIGGSIPYQEIPYYLNTLKLLVVPSFTESGPLISLEAMACGTPVLSTPVGIMPDIINHGENSFLMKSNNPVDITSNILEIMSQKNLQEISVEARKTIEAKFTREAIVRMWKEIFSDIIRSL